MLTAGIDGQDIDLQHALHRLQPLCAHTRRGTGEDWRDNPDRGLSTERVGGGADAQPFHRCGMADVCSRFSCLRRALCHLAGNDALLAGLDGRDAGLCGAVASVGIAIRGHPVGLRHGRCRLGICDVACPRGRDLAPQEAYAALWRRPGMVLATAAGLSFGRPS